MMIPADQLTNAEYHAMKECISSSDVKAVYGKSLAHWKAQTFKATEAMQIGTAVHSFILEDGKDIVRGPENRRLKAWKELEAETDAKGQTLLPEAKYDLARSIADSVLFHPAGQRMAGPTTVNEASFFATDPNTGLKLKCRPDSYWDAKGVLYDVKTCLDASPRGVSKDVGPSGYNYAIQAAFYMYTLNLAGYQADQFVFCNVEKSEPFAVSTNILSPEYLEWGKQQMHLTLDKIAKANEAQKWDTGWSEVTNVIHLPKWLEADF